MNEKLLEILAKAGWLSTELLADQGGFRSTGNVAVALRQLEKAGNVVRHNQQTAMGKTVYWRHADNVLPAPFSEKIAKPVPAESAGVCRTLPEAAPAVTPARIDKPDAEPVAKKAPPVSASKLSAVNAELASENEWLRRQLDERAADITALLVTIEAQANTLATLEDDNRYVSPAPQKPAIAGYLVRTPKKPIRVFAKEETAKKAALAAVRAASFGEVFAIVKVGKAVRGAEWMAA